MPLSANTAPDGLVCKMGKTTINFVGTGVPDGPRDVKQNKPLRVVFELYQGSIRKGWRRRRLKEPARVELSANSNTRADYFNFALRFLIFS